MRIPAVLVSLSTVVLFAAGAPEQASLGTAVFEGARLIVGTGAAPIENATFLVEGARISAVGTAASVRVPAGARRVDLSGKTVMPSIVDTHTHLSTTREALEQDLRRRPFYGVSAAMSLGTDEGDAALEMRGQTVPGMARVFSAGRGITRPEVGRTDVFPTGSTPRPKAVMPCGSSPHGRWTSSRSGWTIGTAPTQKLTPALYTAIIDEAHRNKLRVTAHIFTLDDAKGLLRAGLDAFAHGIRDRDLDDEVVALFQRAASTSCSCRTCRTEA